MQTEKISKTGVLGGVILVGILSFLYATLFLSLLNDFWIDDDATIFAFIKTIENPIDLFVSQELFKQSYWLFTPLQYFSYWIDYRFGSNDPFIAYLHNTLSFTATSVALFLVVSRYLSTATSFFLTSSWMMLPSTIAVTGFIATRHYMEGLLFFLCSVLFTQKSIDAQTVLQRVVFSIISLLFLFLAMICKELYVTVGFLTVLLLYIYNRKHIETTAVIAVGVVYTVYYLWALGVTTNYPAKTMNGMEYLVFLSKIPYIFSGNKFGYGILLALIICFIYQISKRNISFFKILAYLLLIVLNFIIIYPSSIYLLHEWNHHGTWYRLVYLLNLTLLFGIFYVLKNVPTKVKYSFMIVLLFSLAMGAERTIKIWNDMKQKYEVTGKFYINNHQKVVYSQLPAYWYLGGIKQLYDLDHPYILSYSPKDFEYHKFSSINEVWRYRKGEMVPDPNLWSKLVLKFNSSE